MNAAVEWVGYLNNALFVALAIVATQQWSRQRAEATKWFALTFGALSVFVIAGMITPPEGGGSVVDLIRRAELAVLFLFPYFLYRFMGSFVYRARWVRILALLLTGLVIAWTFVVPLGAEDAVEVPVAYVFALLLQWSLLSLLVTVRLWNAGRGQPTVARRRMRLLSMGALGMTATLVVAATGSAALDNEVFSLFVNLLALSSVTLFFSGYAPPAWLRTVWRRRESDAMRSATSELMGARSREEISQRLLPHVVQIAGARGAALVDKTGIIIGSEGVEPEMLREVAAASPTALTRETHTPRLLILPFEFGSLALWASVYTPFFGREEVEIVRALGALTDIALERSALLARERKARMDLELANLELSSREAQLAEAQSISHIGSWEVDLKSERIRWSDEMFKIMGLDPDGTEPTNDLFLSMLHPEDRDYVENYATRAIESGETFQYECRIVRPDGTIRTIDARGRVMRSDNDEHSRLVGIVQDITERKETEKALADAFSRERLSRIGLERANSELESFVYTVSHDLNSPLISVLGYLELLEQDAGAQLPDEGRFYVERMRASATFMQSLIKDLLELSRVGRVQTEPEEVDLNLLIEDIAGEVKSANPDVTIQTSDIPPVTINPVRARQLFANLINNAVKYGGRPDVRIRVTAEPNSNGLVSLSVADNGPGIPEPYRERVFGVFERLENSEEGTGIGLAVCKRIVETNGGQIWIADSDEGTDMRLTVPAADSTSIGSTR
ncbi:MAG: sensor histidine kinase [Actinomycetota bacterium]